MNEPYIHVGILSAPQIEFVLNESYHAQGHSTEGKQTATYDNGRILWNGRLYDELLFAPDNGRTASFDLLDVTIGIGFHWERKEDQRFLGALKIIVEDKKLTAINVLRVEDYLTSVISSEMSATASPELLKAHAVISRSWLLANLNGPAQSPVPAPDPAPAKREESGEHIVWYERSAHTHFDVCADDHCQRYQGITRASTPTVREAIAATRGEVLTYDGQICDARFSKCCGGAFEEFQYCWDNIRHPYLARQLDRKGGSTVTADTVVPCPDLTVESEADRWIRSTPPAFCHTTDKRILSQVLNNYDQETTDFYRWRVVYGQDELADLIRRRSGTDYGQILDLVPVARGTSGRLWKLKIVGSKRTMTIGKELEIRRTLSPSHLYSSAFVVDKEDIGPDGVPARFVLTGAGWGHGVGLCQIGAAVMGEQGYTYDTILKHYYVGAEIEKRY